MLECTEYRRGITLHGKWRSVGNASWATSGNASWATLILLLFLVLSLLGPTHAPLKVRVAYNNDTAHSADAVG